MQTIAVDAADCLRDGRLERATALAVAALIDKPDEATGWSVLGGVGHNQGRHAEAVRCFVRASQINPSAGQTRINAAIAMRAAGLYGPGERQFCVAAAINPASLIVQSWLGALLQEQGAVVRAATHVRRALRIGGATRDCVNLFTLLMDDGRPAAAVKAARCGLIDTPADAFALLCLADCLLATGESAQARTAAERAIRLTSGTQQETAQGAARRARRYVAAAQARAAAPSAGLVVRGPIGGYSGYAHMTGRFVGELRRSGLALDVINVTGAEQAGETRPVAAVGALSFVTPVTFEPVPGLRNAVFSMYEGVEIPPGWARRSEPADLVIVPTRSSRDAWIAAGCDPDRMAVCPLGVDRPADAGKVGLLHLQVPGGASVSERRFRFLNVADLTLRKNLAGLLRVWLRATDAGDNAVLILKPGKGGAGAARAAAAAIRQAEADVGRRMIEAAPLVVVSATLTDDSMEALTAAATHYFSLSCGEGWDLPLSRAAAAGLEIIAPRHSSYLDYLTDDDAYLIPAAVVPAAVEIGASEACAFYGRRWWRPDEEAAARTLRAVLDGVAPPKNGLRDRLLRDFTWAQAGERLVDLLRRRGFVG